MLDSRGSFFACAPARYAHAVLFFQTRFLFLSAIVGATFSSGCSESAQPATPPADAGASVDAAWQCVPGKVWRSTSRSILIGSFGLFRGSSGYEKTREELAGPQLSALDNLCMRPPPTGPKKSDLASYSVAITDADGSVARYVATEGNATGDSSGEAETIDVDSLQTFLRTFSCRAAGETRNQTGPDSGVGDASVETLPQLGSDNGCRHGVSFTSRCGTARFALAVANAASYEVALLDCFTTSRIRLLAADRTTIVAESATGERGACPSLTQRIETPGTYVVEIERTLPGGCATEGMAGDVSFSVKHTP